MAIPPCATQLHMTALAVFKSCRRAKGCNNRASAPALTAAADDEPGLALRIGARLVVPPHAVHVDAQPGEGCGRVKGGQCTVLKLAVAGARRRASACLEALFQGRSGPL